MILLYISLFISVIARFEDIEVDYTTAIYKNNKLYVYEPHDAELKWSGLTIYNLKDGLISDIEKRLINLTNSNPAYAPQFLQLPETLSDKGSNELWMIGGITDDKLKNNTIDKGNWSCEIINDNELKFRDDFIPMPPFKNFPKSGFSQTIVNNNSNPELYIIGGLVYSKELDTPLITNYFFKYEFNTGQWSDLSEKTKSILQPRVLHRVVEVDNSLVLIGGLQNNKTLKSNFGHTIPLKNETDVSDISTIFKFDLKEQRWSVVKTKLNKDVSIYGNDTVLGASFDVYNGRIISYATFIDNEANLYEPRLGILDYKTWEWEWHDVKTEIGTDNSLHLSFHQTLIINDQLMLIHGLSNQRKSKNLFAIDLTTYKFQGFISISGEYEESTTSRLPDWEIATIVISCVILVIILIVSIWFYLRYKKRANIEVKCKQKMQDVWAPAVHETDMKKFGFNILSANRAISSRFLMSSTLIEDLIPNLECFQHEVDLEDLEDLTKVKSKIRAN